MKYRDLVSFESIEQVKELRHADDLAEARRDVETLVVSPRLAEQLTGLILPNMDLDSAPDAKGLLIVANYGTGKTHLMSVVSSILEHSELVDSVRSEAVREAAAPLGGRYRVIRAEIGATRMGAAGHHHEGAVRRAGPLGRGVRVPGPDGGHQHQAQPRGDDGCVRGGARRSGSAVRAG